jgi:hypothetical protein
MDAYERLAACAGFDWDEGNLLKRWEKHGVTAAECALSSWEVLRFSTWPAKGPRR